MNCRNKSNNLVVAPRVKEAKSFFDRLVGLLSRGDMNPDEGLLLMPCKQIHTFFMRFAIDAVFLDSGLRVVKIVRDMRPWRVSPFVLSARGVLELKSGACTGKVQEGDILEFTA